MPLPTLGGVCEAIVDCEHKTAPLNPNGAFFAVGTPAMRGNRIDYSEARRIDRATFEEWTRRLRPNYGDLLLAREAPVGPVVMIPREEHVAPGQRTVLIRPNRERVDAKYLYYLLSSPAEQYKLQGLAEGSTVPHLNVADIRALTLPMLPTMPEQRAIATLLGALDDKIEANRKLAATADALAVALLTPFRPTVPLGTIAKQAKKSVNPAELADREVAHYSLPAFDLESTPESVQASAIKSNKYRIQEPAVLVSKLNPRFPRVWNVPEVGGVPALASTEFVVLEPTICSTSVLWAMAQHPRFARALQSLVAGTSGSHQRVRPGEMLSTLMPDPSAVPQATKSRIDAVVQRSLAAGAESRTLRVLRDTFLPKLMSGALKVREAQRFVAQAV